MNDYSTGDLMAAIRSLQEATALGFVNVEAKFEVLEAKIDAKIDSKVDGLRHEMNRRFDAVDQRFDAMDQRFDGMDRRFDAMDQRVDGLDRRLERLEQTRSH